MMSVIALRHSFDEVMRQGRAGGLETRFLADIGLPISDVVPNGIVKQIWSPE